MDTIPMIDAEAARMLAAGYSREAICNRLNIPPGLLHVCIARGGHERPEPPEGYVLQARLPKLLGITNRQLSQLRRDGKLRRLCCGDRRYVHLASAERAADEAFRTGPRRILLKLGLDP